MDASAAISLVVTVIDTLVKIAPVVAQGIDDLKPFGVALYEKLTGGTISDADLATLEAQIDALYAELEQPMPDVG